MPPGLSSHTHAATPPGLSTHLPPGLNTRLISLSALATSPTLHSTCRQKRKRAGIEAPAALCSGGIDDSISRADA